MEKSVDYYMALPYTVELTSDRKWYRASVKEMPECRATAKASESIEELWRRLKEVQRERIEELLEFGDEVPELPGVSTDPFWEHLPDDIDEGEVRSILYTDGAGSFPLRVLKELWLQELQATKLAETEMPGFPHKDIPERHDGRVPPIPEGELRQVRLGKSRKAAWIRFNGPRNERGYRDVEVLDQPLRTEAAVVAALTVLEASVVRDTDFKRLNRALLEYVAAHPKLGEMDLQKVLARLPMSWFVEQKAAVDQEVKQLTPQERKKRIGQSWERGERRPHLWKRSLSYMVTLLRCRQPGFDARSLEEQLEMLNQYRKHVNKFLEQQRKHAAFLEYGGPEGLPKVVKNAANQVRAAVLADVEGVSHLAIATELGLDVHKNRYEAHRQVSLVANLVNDGRTLLDKVFGWGGWRRKAEEMKAEASRYKALSEEEKEIEALAEKMQLPLEEARSLFRRSPEVARFLAIPF